MNQPLLEDRIIARIEALEREVKKLKRELKLVRQGLAAEPNLFFDYTKIKPKEKP